MERTAKHCEWKWRIENGKKIFKNCVYIADTHIIYAFNYCPYCGKRLVEIPDTVEGEQP